MIKGVSHRNVNSAVAAKVRRECGPGNLYTKRTQFKGAETEPKSELDNLSVEELLKKIPKPVGTKKPERFRQNTNHNCYAVCALKAANGQYSKQFRDDFQKYVEDLRDYPGHQKLHVNASGYDPEHPGWKLHTNATGKTINGKYYMDPLQDFMEKKMSKQGNGYGSAKDALAYITGKKVTTQGPGLQDSNPKNREPNFWRDAKGNFDRAKFKKYVTDQLDKNKTVIVSHADQHSLVITGYDRDKGKLTIKDPWRDTDYTISPKDAFLEGFSGDIIKKGRLTDVTYVE